MPIGVWNYWVVILLMMLGLYNVIARENLIKKIMGLNLFQVSVIMLYITMGKIAGGTAPIVVEPPTELNPVIYSNPVPHVLMLTAIVVGVAVTAVGLSLVVRIRESYGSIEEAEIAEQEREAS